jgi:hypothetical protein
MIEKSILKERGGGGLLVEFLLPLLYASNNKLQKLLFSSQLYDLYSDLADFSTIYIEEAHPTEAEDFVNFVDIKIHRFDFYCRLFPLWVTTYRHKTFKT